MFAPTKTWFRSTISHITLTRTTIFFLVVTLLHTITQSVTQSFLFSLDSRQRLFIQDIIARGDIPAKNTTFLKGDGRGGLVLSICKDIPHGLKGQPYPCTTVFESVKDIGGNQVTRSVHWQHGENVTIMKGVGLQGAVVLQPESSFAIFLSQQCVQTLVEPWQRLTNHRREDIAHITLQLWLLIISVFGVVNDSVPHILSAGVIRLLSTQWAIYAVWRCTNEARIFRHILSNPGTPCSLDVFSVYDSQRLRIQVADMVLSVIALGIALFLSWKLVRRYNAQSFKCVGAPAHVQRINKFFLALLATLQLEVFILTCGMSMWIDVLLNTAIARISAHTPEYIGVFVISATVLIPWIVMGWFSIKRERPYFTLAFLIIGFLIIFGWSIMFYSIVYRWTFTQWPFLGCFTVASMTLLVTSMALGIVCRLNFGKGHAEYLRAEENLSSFNFPQATFTRDDKREAFDLIEDGQIYCVQTKVMVVDDPDTKYSNSTARDPSLAFDTEKRATSPLSDSPSSTKKPFDWDIDPLTSSEPRKLKPFELESRFKAMGMGNKGDGGLRKFSWESVESESGGLPKLSKLDPVVYPRTNRF